MTNDETLRPTPLDAAGDFGRRLAHEVRSPTGTVIGALTELERGSVEPESAQRLASLAEKASRRLMRLAERLDWLTALADGSAVGTPQPFGVASALSHAIDDAERFAARSRISIERPRVDPDLRLRADEAALRRTLEEVIHNAVRNARSTVTVGVEVDDERVEVVVRDDGRGIDAHTREGLFQPQRGVGSGLGVGLWLARSLAERAGQTLQLVRTGGDGSCFSLVIPRKPR